MAGFEPTTSWSQTRRDNRTTLHPEGDHDRIRTCDRLLRRQMLYPAELRDPIFQKKYFKKNISKMSLKGTLMKYFIVGAAGFEPATSWSQTRRDDRTTLRPEKLI